MSINESHNIIISSPMKQDYIIELLDAQTIEDITFSFVSKQGIKMTFSYENGSKEEAIRVAKDTIKATEIGSVLYFQVV